MLKRVLLPLLFVIISVSCLQGYNLELSGDDLLIIGDPGELEIGEITVGLGRFTTIETSSLRQGGAVGTPELPHFSEAVALPASGNWKITKLTYDVKEIDIDYPLLPSGWEDMDSFDSYRGTEWYPQEIVTVSAPSIMRDYRFSQVTVAAVQYNADQGKLRIYSNLYAEFEIDTSDLRNPLESREIPHSPAFAKLAESMIFGVDQYRIEDDQAGSLLIITRSSLLSYVEVLAEWKRQKGFATVVATTTETGSSTSSIRNYIVNAYENWENPPDHVILVGDESGSYSIPTYFCEGYMYPYDATDHDYAMLAGTDYFPDVLLGRLSVRSSSEMATVVSKIINYEKEPYMDNTSWYTKGLMMSVIEDSWGNEYYSGRETVICAGNKLLDFTYTQVDTFIAPEQSSASQLRNLINTGYTFLNYRGFGSTYYWQGSWGGHMFETSNISTLSNGWMLPMVTSIVCGGGDYADDNYATCFGEEWVKSGSSTNPRGGIAFIGPSEHDTKTPFNNCNDLGIYQGITQEGIFGTSAMMLRGKMELYNNFPYCHGWGGAEDSDQFYFYVYNLLGDPTLDIWTDVPRECELEVASEIAYGANYLDVSVTSIDNNVEGFRIAVTNDDELVAVAITNASGNAYIPVELAEDDYVITATRYGYIPCEQEIEVVSGSQLGVEGYTTSVTPQAGENFELNLLIENYSVISAANISCEIYNYDDSFDIVEDTAVLSLLEGGAQAELSFELVADERWLDGRSGQIFCNILSSLGSTSSMVEVSIAAPELTMTDIDVNTSSGNLQQNVSSELNLELYNAGDIASGSFSSVLMSLDSNALVSQNMMDYGNINSGTASFGNSSFVILPADVIDGEAANLQLSLYKDNELVQVIPVTIPIGDIDETSPTYDNYGYMAIESSDEGNFTAPEYEWEEISPYAGGDGTYLNEPHMHETTDGWIDQLNLPFTFQYYGEDFDRITVCQNGYFSFGNANTLFFRNKSLPSGYGPGGMVCPFWEDLTEGYVYYWYDEDNHRFLIEWKNMRMTLNQNYRQYFEVILYDPEYYPTATGDGEILFVYQQVNNIDNQDNYATVGIESPDKTMGLQISFADYYPETAHELDDETAILFTPVQPATMGVMYGDVDANGAVEAFDASITLQYFVGIDPGAVAPLPWDQWRITRGDVDGNGTVEAYDGSLILQYFVGIISEFPVERARRK